LFKLLFQNKRIGTEVNVFPALDQLFYEFTDVRVEQWLSTRDTHYGHPTLLNSIEALLDSQVVFEDVRGVLDFATACARQITAKQRLQHQNEWVPLAAHHSLLEHVGCDGPGLGGWYAHCYFSLVTKNSAMA
jgi:hypothetical protein